MILTQMSLTVLPLKLELWKRYVQTVVPKNGKRNLLDYAVWVVKSNHHQFNLLQNH